MEGLNQTKNLPRRPGLIELATTPIVAPTVAIFSALQILNPLSLIFSPNRPVQEWNRRPLWKEGDLSQATDFSKQDWIEIAPYESTRDDDIIVENEPETATVFAADLTPIVLESESLPNLNLPEPPEHFDFRRN